MADQPKVQVRLIPEPARQGMQHIGYRAKAYVRVWQEAEITEYPFYGPTTVVKTKREANAIMRSLVMQHLRAKGWMHAEIIEATDPGDDDRSLS